MAYNYNPLWATLERLDKSTYYLINNGLNSQTLHKLKHNQNVNVETLNLICQILNCSVNDVVEISNNIKEDNK